VTIVYWEDARATLSCIGGWHRLLIQLGDLCMPVIRGDDIREAKRSGKVGVIFGFQNCSPIEGDLELVQVFHELGVRIMQLTYNNQSLIGAGRYEKMDAGTSRFGREVIREMNRVGMIVDLSRSAEHTSLQAIELSERPVANTHANPASFHAALRNKFDDLLRALALSGSMLGFSLYPFHLRDSGQCTLESFCRIVVDTAELMSIDHIGLGSNMCRGWGYETLEWMRSGRWTFGPDYGEGSADKPTRPEQPPWFRTPADMPNITRGLLDRGLDTQEVGKILGGNWLRFFSEGFESNAARTTGGGSEK